MNKIYHLLSILFVFQTVCSFGQIKPARIFSDNMVLQREVALPVWGTAKPGEPIVVRIASSEVKTTTQPDGHWMANLPQLAAGGPYSLIVEGYADRIEFKNILIGDVWFASGQSNMEHPIKGWEYIPHSAITNYEQEIADSNYPEIRVFQVPKFPSPVVQKDLAGGQWEVAGPQSVAGFSSLAWFFGKELYQKLKVPIGIIDCSWGGTPIQTWMSRESLEQFKDSLNIPAVPANFDQKEWSEKVTESIEKNRIRRNQISYPPKGLPEEISNSKFNDSSWIQINMLDEPSHFGNILWLRKKINIPELEIGKPLTLSLGFLNWQSNIYLNGTELAYCHNPKQVSFEIPANLLRPGENILAIRLAQPFGGSQVLGSPEQFFLSNTDKSFLSKLSESWQANDQLETVISPTQSYQSNPAFLFNGMVAPVILYRIKGCIWYQGESDAGRPQLYEQIFRQLIVNWRKLWKQDDLPFLFVQLSNLELSHKSKLDSWCLLREAQKKALLLPNTGMAVSIDIGDQYNIHPKNKKDFGHRLALQALKVAYHQNVIADGPVYESIEIKGDTVVVQINDQSSQLMAINPKDLSGFEMAGKDGVFHEAKAFLKNHKIFVSCKKIKNPVAVRYAWTNNPCCSVFNAVGLPMAPFRMGNFKN